MTIHIEFNKIFSRLLIANRIQMYSGLSYGSRTFLFSKNLAENNLYLSSAQSSSISEVFGDGYEYTDNLLDKNIVFCTDVIPILEEIFLSNKNDSEFIDYFSKLLSSDKSYTKYINEIKTLDFLVFSLNNKKAIISNKNIDKVLNLFKESDFDSYSTLTNFSFYEPIFIKKIENKLTISQFLLLKFPDKKEQINKKFKIKTQAETTDVNLSTSLLSCKYLKEDFYKMFPSFNVNKEVYWSNLSLVCEFFNKNKNQYGINYAILDGFNDNKKNFNLIIEKNENFLYKDDLFYSVVLKIYELFKDYPKNYKIKSIDISNADKLYNYYLIKNDVVNDKKADNKKNKI